MAKSKKSTSKANKKKKSPSGKDPLQKTPFWAIPIAIFLLTTIVFFPSTQNGFTNWDDGIYVLENVHVVDEDAPILSNIFDPDQQVLANYDPLSTLSLAISGSLAKGSEAENAVNGLSPAPFHWTNYILHLLNILLVFWWVWLFSKKNKLISLIVTVLFAIHPLHVEPVAWISSRKDVLYAFFMLLSLISYAWYLDKKHILWLGFSFLAFGASVLSKPVVVVLPIILLGYDWYENRKLETKIFLEKLPFFAVSFIAGWFALGGQRDIGVLADDAAFGIESHLMFGCFGLVNYVVKAVIPFEVSAFYPYPHADDIPSYFYLMPVIVIGMITLVIWKGQEHRIIWFGSGFFLVNVFLVLKFFSFGNFIMADRYTYVAYLGLFLIIAFGLNHLYQQNKGRTLILAGTGVVVLFFSMMSLQQVKVWENSFTLWDQVCDQYPDHAAIAFNNRGLWQKDQENFQEALNDFDRACQIEPNSWRWRMNRGNLLRDLAYNNPNGESMLTQSLDDLNFVISKRPEDADAYNSRALSYLDKGNYKAAEADLNKALELDPELEDALANRAVFYLNENRFSDALKDFDKYLSVYPEESGILGLRGYTNFRAGNFDQSKKDLDRGLELESGAGDLYLFRAFTLDTLGQYQDALRDLNMAEQMGQPVDPSFRQKIKDRLQD